MKTKNFLKILLPYFFYVPIATAQLSAGNNGIFVSDATILTVDGLSLVTDGEFEMTNNTLSMSHTPAAGEFKFSIKRVYSFAVPILYHGGVGIHYTLTELNGNEEDKLQIAVVGTPSLILFTSGGSTVFPSSSYIYNTINLPVTVISAMDEGTDVLPITLISFNATRENNAVLLTWVTSEETNSNHFEIQKSNNGTDWKAITTVGAAKESNQKKTYTFTDLTSFNKTFYRLKMVDLDDSYAFSRIREIDGLPGYQENIVYPNPVQNTLHMKPELVNRLRSASIYDVNGKLMIQLAISTENDVQKLSSGIYLLQISYMDGSTGSFRIVKI